MNSVLLILLFRGSVSVLMSFSADNVDVFLASLCFAEQACGFFGCEHVG